MRPADRLFQIVLQLGRGRVLTARYLADMLEVSERTIYRDIADLMASGVPIYGEAGVGYRLQSGYQVPPMMFDQDELQALIFGAEVAKRWGDKQMGAAADRILNKVDAVLPQTLRPVLNSRALVVPQRASDQSEQTQAQLGGVRDAINERARLWISYRDVRGESSQRTVWPLTLVYWGFTWTLGAWCELREAFRSFRIDRIESAETAKQGPRCFPDVAGQRLADYFAQLEQPTDSRSGKDANANDTQIDKEYPDKKPDA